MYNRLLHTLIFTLTAVLAASALAAGETEGSNPAVLAASALAAGETEGAGSAVVAASGRTVWETDTVAEESAVFCIHFPVGKSGIRQNFKNNRAALSDMKAFLEKVDSDSARILTSIELSSSVSPEGPRQINERLLRERAASLQQEIERLGHDCPPATLIYADAATPRSHYPEKRYAEAAFLTARITRREVKLPEPELPEPVLPEPEEEPVVEAEPAVAEEPAELAEELLWQRRMYVKSNLPAWGLLISNAAFEIDVARHWSVTVPVYYSAINYFSSTVKFRTLTIQPEVRYWFGSDGGWFVGAHAGLGWFNFALDGPIRYQDHDGRSPGIGGGLSAGYRMNLGHSGRWRLEFALGAGVYHVNFDRFENRPNGPLTTSSTRRTWAGVDNAAVTLSYSFDY